MGRHPVSAAGLALYWTTFTLMWIVVLLAVLAMRRVRRAVAAHTADRDGLENWARWTMISVVDRTGDINAWTIRQLYNSRITERFWEEPATVSFWHADPTAYDEWQQEAVRAFNPEQPSA